MENTLGLWIHRSKKRKRFASSHLLLCHRQCLPPGRLQTYISNPCDKAEDEWIRKAFRLLLRTMNGLLSTTPAGGAGDATRGYLQAGLKNHQQTAKPQPKPRLWKLPNHTSTTSSSSETTDPLSAPMRFVILLHYLLTIAAAFDCFTSVIKHAGIRKLHTALHEGNTSDNEILNDLTPQLRKMTQAFASIPDEKTRYKQLLYMANQLPRMDPSRFVPENKVPGCLSTVYMDCESSVEETSPDSPARTVINFMGDSDGLLTKGLVAFLVKGLSGYTAEEIQQVSPEFIRLSKISQSLTPGRNNGFLNMIAVMKRKAQALADSSNKDPTDSTNSDPKVEADIVTTFEERQGKPMYNAIMNTLISKLKPKRIELDDNSDQHSGHVGSRGWEESGESHFALLVVSDVFEGLNLVKRHQLIYLLLGEVMSKIHALQIMALTAEEMELQMNKSVSQI